MSQEMLIVLNCDICQKDSKAKVSEGTETFVIKINQYEREIDLCPKHQSTKHTIASLIESIAKYGRKPLRERPPALPNDSLTCICGKSFETQGKMNMHIGQANRKHPGQHTRAVEK